DPRNSWGRIRRERSHPNDDRSGGRSWHLQRGWNAGRVPGPLSVAVDGLRWMRARTTRDDRSMRRMPAWRRSVAGPVTDLRPRLLTLDEAAQRSGRPVELLREWCATGRIECERLGGRWLVPESTLEAIRSMPTEFVPFEADGSEAADESDAADRTEADGGDPIVAIAFRDRLTAVRAAGELASRFALGRGGLSVGPLALDGSTCSSSRGDCRELAERRSRRSSGTTPAPWWPPAGRLVAIGRLRAPRHGRSVARGLVD